MSRDSAVHRTWITTSGLALVLIPSLALAHGQQIFFIPVGQLIALVPVAFIAWRLTRGWFVRIAVIACALLVPTIILFMPSGYIPWWLVADEIRSFLTGFVFSVLVACALGVLYRIVVPGKHGT
jgi:hypothetical protein